MRPIKNKIYIDNEGEGWVCDRIDPLNLIRLRYPNFSWIGHPESMKDFFIETEIEYTPDFWDKAKLKDIDKYWKEVGKNVKIMKFKHNISVRN